MRRMAGWYGGLLWGVALAALGRAGEAPVAPPAGGAEAPKADPTAARQTRRRDGPPPWLFAVTGPGTGRTFYVQGYPAAPLDMEKSPFHPGLAGLLDRAERVYAYQGDIEWVHKRAADAAAGPDAGRFAWTPEQRAEWEAWVPRVRRRPDGVYTIAHGGKRLLVETDVGPAFAAQLLRYALAVRDSIDALLPRTRAAPRRRREIFNGFVPAALEMAGVGLYRVAAGYPMVLGYDTIVRVWGDPGRYGHFLLGLTDADAHCETLETTAFVEMTVREGARGEIDFTRLDDTRAVLRHELAHALFGPGPGHWREHTFVHEGFATFYQDLDPRAADPVAEAERVAGAFDLRAMADELAAEGVHGWPRLERSLSASPLAWLFWERPAAHTLTYRLGQAFATFMFCDPGRRALYDAAVARVNAEGGRLFTDEQVAELDAAWRGIVRDRFRAARPPRAPAAAVDDALARLPALLRLPGDRRLIDTLADPDLRWLWRDARRALADLRMNDVPVLPVLERCRPLVTVALGEMGDFIRWSIPPRDPAMVPFADQTADKAALVAVRLAGMTPEAEQAEFARWLRLMKEWATGFPAFLQKYTGVAEAEQDAFFAGDRAFLAPDPDFAGWGRDRVHSEWERRLDAPAFARMVADALAEPPPEDGGGAPRPLVGLVPLHFLADLPGNTLALLEAQGFRVAAVAGRDP